MLPFGAVLSCLILYFIPILDKYGRKNSIFIGDLVVIVGLIILFSVKLAADDNEIASEIIVFGLFVLGCGVGIISISAPKLIGEYCPRCYRAQMVGIFQLFITFGIVFCVIIAIIMNQIQNGWVYSLIVLFCLPCLQLTLICVFKLPTSPRWLLCKQFSLPKQSINKEDDIDEYNNADKPQNLVSSHDNLNENKEKEKKNGNVISSSHNNNNISENGININEINGHKLSLLASTNQSQDSDTVCNMYSTQIHKQNKI